MIKMNIKDKPWWIIDLYKFKYDKPKSWMLALGPYRIGFTLDVTFRNLDKKIT